MSLNHFVFNLFFSYKIMTTVESENRRLCVVEILCQVFFFFLFDSNHKASQFGAKLFK